MSSSRKSFSANLVTSRPASTSATSVARSSRARDTRSVTNSGTTRVLDATAAMRFSGELWALMGNIDFDHSSNIRFSQSDGKFRVLRGEKLCDKCIKTATTS